MRILHCCLSNFYIDNYNYQENVLPIMNMIDGHDVKIIASTETFIDNKKLGYLEPSKYYTNEGIEINRIPYKKYLPHFIMKKVRHYENLYNLIEEFSPDIIMFHGIGSYELITIKKYKKNNPYVKVYIDNHADKNNSARNWLSRNILHKIYYKTILKKANDYIDKIFYLTYETKMFLIELYDVDEEKMEFYPLGGYIFSEEERDEKRTKIRKELDLKEDDVLLVHSGKLDKRKRTKELIEAITMANKNNLRLVIIGSIPEEQSYLKGLIEKDDKISYLGWKNPDELLEYLCACDLYVQPGSQSATMQNALCCGSAAMLYPHQSHIHLLGDSVFYIETVDDMVKLFQDVAENRDLLEDKRLQSFKIAKEKLDYKILAARLYR